MTEELNACPFCGDYGVEEAQSGTPNIKGWFKRSVFCKTCFCEGPPAKTTAEAIENWNLRASPNLIGLPVIDPELLGKKE